MPMRRKRASPAPAFRQPAPFDPTTGQYAPIGRQGILSRCAMMQIVGDDETVTNEDTHDDYVVCRGFDPETRKFYDSLNVAKPYGIRGTNPYQLAEVYPAIKPKTALGDTSGVAATTTGHPANLAEEVEILKDDDENPIAWLLLTAPDTLQLRWGKLADELTVGGTTGVNLWQTTDGGWEGWDEDSLKTWQNVYAPPVMTTGTVDASKWVLVGMVNGRKVVLFHQC